MRLLHTMLRVGDLDRSIAFYCDVMGMKLLRRKDYPQGRFTLAFLGYGSEKKQTVLELTHNWGVEEYELGSGFGHLAVEVDDVQKAFKRMVKAGGTPLREPAPMNAGKTFIAFMQDPDGYPIELIAKRKRDG